MIEGAHMGTDEFDDVTFSEVCGRMFDEISSGQQARNLKALTICQPYAELILNGEKLVENRTWPTSHRGDLIIHAGKSKEWLCGLDPKNYVFGAIVGFATLVDIVPFERRANIRMIRQNGINYEWLNDHEHAHGPFCWILEKACRLPEPIPYRGAQGLFDVHPMVLDPSVGAIL